MIHLNKIRLRVRHILTIMLTLVTISIVPVSAKEKPGDSALTARKVFEKLGCPALELLRESSRFDMLDYWDVDSVYVVKNALYGESSLQEVTPDYLKVKITPVSSLEIKLLPVKDDTVVMTIYTVGGEGQAPDSMVEFYDSDLRKLDTKRFFTEPDLKYFFNLPKGSSVTLKQLRELIPFPTIEYSAMPGKNDVTAKLTVAEYMNVDDRELIKRYLQPQIVMDWKGKYKAK